MGKYGKNYSRKLSLLAADLTKNSLRMVHASGKSRKPSPVKCKENACCSFTIFSIFISHVQISKRGTLKNETQTENETEAPCFGAVVSSVLKHHNPFLALVNTFREVQSLLQEAYGRLGSKPINGLFFIGFELERCFHDPPTTCSWCKGTGLYLWFCESRSSSLKPTCCRKRFCCLLFAISNL